MPKIDKQLFYSTGVITKISEKETIVRPGKTPVDKVNVYIEREDGQKGTFEVRTKPMYKILKGDFKVGDKVEFGFIFIGSEKNNKFYNNLFINELRLCK